MSETQPERVTNSKPYGRFIVAKTLWDTLRHRGPVELFRLIYVMLRYRLRSTYDDNTRTLVIAFHGMLGVAGVALLALVFGMDGGTTATSIAARLGGAITGFALLFVAATWFLMPAFQRSVLLGEVVASVCYGFLCVALCWFGWRHAVDLAARDPRSLTTFILLSVVVMVAFGHPLSLFARFLVMRATANHYAFETPYHQILAVRPRTGGFRQTAVHEAGHALMYALGARIPEDASAFIDTDTLSPSVGQVSFPGGRNGDFSYDLLEWKLFTCLAGLVAEKIDSGTHGFGAGGDMRVWQDLAIPYLLLRTDITFFEEPKSDLEMESNKRELVTLKKQMLVAVTRFLRVNWTAVMRIADRLEEAEYLDFEQLAHLLKGVKRTAGLPTAVWPVELGGIELQAGEQ